MSHSHLYTNNPLKVPPPHQPASVSWQSHRAILVFFLYRQVFTVVSISSVRECIFHPGLVVVVWRPNHFFSHPDSISSGQKNRIEYLFFLHDRNIVTYYNILHWLYSVNSPVASFNFTQIKERWRWKLWRWKKHTRGLSPACSGFVT